MPIKKTKNKEKNLIVELYQIKFKTLKPISKSLEDLQIRKIVRPDTTYAQGFSDGFDSAIEAMQKIMVPYEINNKNNEKK